MEHVAQRKWCVSATDGQSVADTQKPGRSPHLICRALVALLLPVGAVHEIDGLAILNTVTCTTAAEPDLLGRTILTKDVSTTGLTALLVVLNGCFAGVGVSRFGAASGQRGCSEQGKGDGNSDGGFVVLGLLQHGVFFFRFR